MATELPSLNWAGSGDTAEVDGETFRFRVLGLDTDHELVVLKTAEIGHDYEQLIRRERPDRIVELGMKDGGSAALLAVAARPEVLVGIDLGPVPERLTDLGRRRGLDGRVYAHGGVDQADHLTRLAVGHRDRRNGEPHRAARGVRRPDGHRCRQPATKPSQRTPGLAARRERVGVVDRHGPSVSARRYRPLSRCPDEHRGPGTHRTPPLGQVVVVAAHVDAVELARDLAGLRLGQRQRVVEARTTHRDQLAVEGPDAGQGAQLVFGRRLAELLKVRGRQPPS